MQNLTNSALKEFPQTATEPADKQLSQTETEAADCGPDCKERAQTETQEVLRQFVRAEVANAI